MERTALFETNDGTNGLSCVHLVKSRIDLVERKRSCDIFLHFENTLHIVLHQAGEFRASTITAKGRTFPNAPSNQLEGARGNLSSCRGYANDHACTPSFVACFERRAHQ